MTLGRLQHFCCTLQTTAFYTAVQQYMCAVVLFFFFFVCFIFAATVDIRAWEKIQYAIHAYIHNWPTHYFLDHMLHMQYKILLCILCTRLIHTYIHNWPLKPFSQNYDLTSLILSVSGGTYNLNSIFEKLYSQRNLLRGSHQRNIFHISFLMTGLGLESWLYM